MICQVVVPKAFVNGTLRKKGDLVEYNLEKGQSLPPYLEKAPEGAVLSKAPVVQVNPASARVQELENELASLRKGHDDACGLIAAMHGAVVGEGKGPIRGVLEDVQDMAKANREGSEEVKRLNAEVERLSGEVDRLNKEAKKAK